MTGTITGWEPLEARGIADAARAAGWAPYEYKGRAGWIYPIASTKLPGQRRWKAADGGAQGPKYTWDPPSAEARPRYYFANGLQHAIQESSGVMYLASGEPDVLAYAAAGIYNVLCWFGENAVPDTLVHDLKALHVTEVINAFDRDKTGYEAAGRVAKLLQSGGIAYRALALTDELDSHFDINKLWIECEFKPDVFKAKLAELSPVEFEGTPQPEGVIIDWNLAYEEWCQETERIALRTWDIDPQRHGDWSRKHFSSPLRQEDKPSARWNYATHGFKDFGTGEFYNTQQVADLVAGEAWEDYKARVGREAKNVPLLVSHLALDKPKTAPQLARVNAEVIRVVCSDDALATVISWLDGKVSPSEPILSPYSAMHSLGGMAKNWERRKIIYVIGGAGMGKTAYMETGADGLRRRGCGVMYWGPEWTPEEVQMKAIARNGGPSFDAQRNDHTWTREEARGVPIEKRSGKRMSDEDRELAYKIAYQIASWPGKAYYIDKANISIETVMAKVIEVTTAARERGEDIGVFFCDYLQKAKLPGTSGHWDELESKVNVISYACIEANLVGVIASQVGKVDSRQLRRNTRLDHSSAQGLSDQLCNLYITLNPVFDKAGNRLEKGVIGVEKNSTGYSPAAVTVKTALYRHYWSDKITTIDVDEYQPTTFTDQGSTE